MQDVKYEQEMFKAMGALGLVSHLEKLLKERPGITAAELFMAAQGEANSWVARASKIADVSTRSVGDCINCGRPVTRYDDNRLVHLTRGGTLSNVGCRAASYDWLDEGWDDTLARTLTAKLSSRRGRTS